MNTPHMDRLIALRSRASCPRRAGCPRSQVRHGFDLRVMLLSLHGDDICRTMPPPFFAARNPMPHEILKPRNDVVFKRLMSDKRLLVSFLQSALDLPPEDYADVQIVDPHLLGERPEDKLGILDVKVTTGQGNIIDIEIQLKQLRRLIVGKDTSIARELAQAHIQRFDGIRCVDNFANLRRELEEHNDIGPIVSPDANHRPILFALQTPPP
jgi:hypothetical protein